MNGTMMKLAALAALAFVALALPATAQGRGSAEDQQACTPDVYKFCEKLIPDEKAIVACLRKNAKRLTPACAKVMAR